MPRPSSLAVVTGALAALTRRTLRHSHACQSTTGPTRAARRILTVAAALTLLNSPVCDALRPTRRLVRYSFFQLLFNCYNQLRSRVALTKIL